MDLNDLRMVLARALGVTVEPRQWPVVTRWHWLALVLSYGFLFYVGWKVLHG
jgi:hypothetical protein